MRKIAKASAIFAVTAVMTAGMAMTAMAGQWVQDQKGWRYQKHDGSYLTDCSQWLDGNQDGIAERYFFDASGYMYSDTSVPVLLSDGSTINEKVNADGQMIGGKPTLVDNQWILDDTKPWIMEALPTLPVTGSGAYSTDEYDQNGISLAALDMFGHTREENAKYGELFVEKPAPNYDWLSITYENGLTAQYYLKWTDSPVVTEIGAGRKDVTKIFKYAADSNTDTGLLKLLKAKGYNCFINAGVNISDLRSDFDGSYRYISVRFDKIGAISISLTECTAQ